MFRFLFNPVGELLFSLPKAVDRRLSPEVGLFMAIVMAVALVSWTGMLAYVLRDEIGRATGLLEPAQPLMLSGTVIAIDTLAEKIGRVKQRVYVRYQHGGELRTLEHTEIKVLTEEYKVNDDVKIYVVEPGRVTLRSPNDSFTNMAATVIFTAFALAYCTAAWRYLAYRRRLFNASRPQRHDSISASKARTHGRVLSTSERVRQNATRW
jgi:hypothetical protein